MKLLVVREVDVNESFKKEMSSGLGSLEEELLRKAITAVEDGLAEVSVKERTELHSKDIIKHYKHGSTYMFYQLIQTTPRIKQSLIKSYMSNKDRIIRDIDKAIEYEPLQQILDRSPDYAIEETRAIVYIVSLAVNEADDIIKGREYTQMILEAMPFMKNMVNRYKRQKDEHDMYLDIARKFKAMDKEEAAEYTPQNKEEVRLINHVMSEHTNSVVDVRDLFEEIEPFRYEDIQTEAKKIKGQYDKQQVYIEKTTGNPFKHTVQEMYVLGTLQFMDFQLELFPESAYEYNSIGEIMAYSHHLGNTYRVYASEQEITKIKRSKAKDRPIRIQNNQTLWEVIEDLDPGEADVWNVFVSQLYTMLDKRADLVLNHPISKDDIDLVTQLIMDWNDKISNSSVDKIGREEQAKFFIIGIISVVFERLQENNENATEETIIRLDQALTERFEKMISRKDQEIERLNARVEQLNNSLSQIDSLTRKNKELQEQLDWQEERTIQEDAYDNADEDNSIEVDPNEIRDRLNNEDVCFLGGDIKWQQALSKDLPAAKFYVPEEAARSMRHVASAKIIVYNSATMNHGMFYRFKNKLKKNKNNPSIVYINSQSSNKERTYTKIGQRLLKRGDEDNHVI